jgi:uncharacterized Zn finger protein
MPAKRWRSSEDDYYEPSYEEADDSIPRNKTSKRLEQDLAEKRADGAALEPMLPTNARGLSETFWGQAWNKHLQVYADQVSSLNSGRKHYRKGLVMDLDIHKGRITAFVAHHRLWEVQLHLATLDAESWRELRQAALGKIDDVADLLAGEVPKALLEKLTQPETGLFPAPSDIKAICGCLDHSRLCEHAAAVLYAVSTKLDSSPELLFRLRGGQPQDLLAKLEEVVTDLTQATPEATERQAALGHQSLSDLFGIDIDD